LKVAITLPISINKKVVGTCFVAGANEKYTALITALHLIDTGNDIFIGLPPHGGDISKPQLYPLTNIPAIDAKLGITEPLLDLAIVLVDRNKFFAPSPNYVKNINEIKVGEEVVIVGYPFAPMGSFLETADISRVSAIGNRLGPIAQNRFELIISHQTHFGSSGSPVVRRIDGSVCGIIRGCLAPPSALSLGNIPLGTDSSVTYATFTEHIPDLLNEAYSMGDLL